VVGKGELPERNLEVGDLRVVRVEGDGKQQEVRAVRRVAAVVEDRVVPRVVEGEAGEALQRRVVLAQAVQQPDVVLDVDRVVVVPGADLVLLGVEVLLLARHRRRLAVLEAVVDAVVRAQRRGEEEADAEAGHAARLEVDRVDVGRVDEEVRPHVVAAFLCGELGEVLGELVLGVAPGEVAVGLVEADLAEALHHLGLGKGFGEEDHLRVDGADLLDQPLPERKRLGVRVVDAEDAHALVEPEEHDAAPFVPDRWQGVAVEVDVDDVLVLLRRVLGELDRAVGPPVEPLGVLLDPRMVGRALDGEVDGDLEAMVGRGGDQAAEAVEVAELGVERVVAALLRADRVGATGVVGRRCQRVVAALAIGPADRMDRREVEHVEAEVAHVRKAGDHVIEGAVAVGAAGLRAGEELVPGAELSALTVDEDGEGRVGLREVGALGAGVHQGSKLVVHQEREAVRLGVGGVDLG
jgi:hypothetical protein